MSQGSGFEHAWLLAEIQNIDLNNKTFASFLFYNEKTKTDFTGHSFKLAKKANNKNKSILSLSVKLVIVQEMSGNPVHILTIISQYLLC